VAGRVLDLSLHLLDRQIVDRDGRMIANVADLDLEMGADGDLYVTGLLCGAQALGPRLGGRLGWWVTQTARRLARDVDPSPGRIDIGLVDEIGSSVVLAADHGDIHVSPLERWFERYLISRIPGSRHESEPS
jgi:sporulation protein YlmC with PRC-barrel domain